MLYIDMICVQWRHAGKNGRIIVRGTDNTLLFRSSLVPKTLITPSNMDFDVSGTCFYFHTKEYVSSDNTNPRDKAQCPPTYAISTGIDVKLHPIIALYYNDRFAEEEKHIGTVDITYNSILFKKGIFTDSVMKTQSYGVLLLCHAIPDQPTHVVKIQTLLNWRACRQLIRQHLRIMAHRSAPAITTAADMQSNYTFSTKHCDIDNKKPPGDLSSNSRQWDTSLYESLKQTVSSTFNLHM